MFHGILARKMIGPKTCASWEMFLQSPQTCLALHHNSYIKCPFPLTSRLHIELDINLVVLEDVTHASVLYFHALVPPPLDGTMDSGAISSIVLQAPNRCWV